MTSITNLPQLERDRVRRRLVLFYETYSPDKMESVNKAMRQDRTEYDLFEALYEKYHISKNEERKHAEQNNLLPASSVSSTGKVSEANNGVSVEENPSGLTSVANYPPLQRARFTKRITNFYKKYAPASVANAARAYLLVKTEEEIFQILYAKYNVFSQQEEIDANSDKLLPPWFDQDLIKASPLSKFAVVGKCPRTKLPFIKLPLDISQVLASVFNADAALHHLTKCSLSNDVDDSTYFFVITPASVTICDSLNGKMKAVIRLETIRGIFIAQGDARMSIFLIEDSSSSGNIFNPPAFSTSVLKSRNCVVDFGESVAERKTVIDILARLKNKIGGNANARMTISTVASIDDIVAAGALEVGEEGPQEYDGEDAFDPETVLVQQESLSDVANVPDRTEGGSLSSLKGTEKIRAATRLYLFYRNHVSATDRRVFQKIPGAMKLSAGEKYILWFLCTRYNVLVSQEKREAWEAGLLPGDDVADFGSPRANGQNLDSSAYMNASGPLSPTRSKSKKGSKPVELPSTIREQIDGGNFAVIDKSGQVFISVPKDNKQNINLITGPERERIVQRMRHFYTVFASYVPDIEKKVADAMVKLAVTEKILLDILCRKYMVDSHLEETEARAAKLLPAEEMKKNVFGEVEGDDPMNGGSRRDDTTKEMFQDDYLYSNDPMNAIGLSYSQQTKKASSSSVGAEPGSPGSPGRRNRNKSGAFATPTPAKPNSQLQQQQSEENVDEEYRVDLEDYEANSGECAFCSAKDAEIAELKKQLEDLQLEKEFVSVELEEAKEALAQFA